MTHAHDESETYSGPSTWDLITTYTCDNCGRLTLACITVYEHLKLKTTDYIDNNADKVMWLPLAGTPREFEDVPSHLADPASEAYQCASIGAYRAAISLTRSVLEAVAKDKGFTTGRLVDKIDQMREADLIRPHIREVAHEIRHLGNDMAHGDFVDPVSAEEARESLVLMEEVLKEVYQSPARVARVRAARAAKQQSAQATP